jgi:hypothetical protein
MICVLEVCSIIAPLPLSTKAPCCISTRRDRNRIDRAALGKLRGRDAGRLPGRESRAHDRNDAPAF